MKYPTRATALLLLPLLLAAASPGHAGETTYTPAPTIAPAAESLGSVPAVSQNGSRVMA